MHRILSIIIAPVCSFLLVMLAASAAATTTNDQKVSYEVNENTGAKASLGSLWASLGQPKQNRTFRIIPASRYFSIDESGNVRLEASIDREDPAVCPDTGEAQAECAVEFNAFASDESIRTVVRVVILDENDNSPAFKTPQQVVSIEEGDARFRCPLDLATDADVGVNGMGMSGHYFLVGGDGLFDLERTPRGLLYLIPSAAAVAKPLDFEERQEHSLNLTACDGGLLRQRCTSRRLLVRVRDRNDNSPNVTSDRWADVSEALPVGSPVARVAASDLDSGENGRLTFAISDARAAETFDIDAANGTVTLKRRLNARERSNYEVKVLVSDNGTPSRQTVASFQLHIVDVNDHAPSISVESMRSQTTASSAAVGSTSVEVRENTPSEAGALAFVQVTDEDTGANARTSCQLEADPSLHFQLRQSSGQDYLLYCQQPLDYEQTPHAEVTVRCQDVGSPPQTSSHRVTIKVVNVNEFAPTFDASKMTSGLSATIEEFDSSGRILSNGTIGSEVLRVEAIDSDRGEQLTFDLLDDGVVESHSRFFEIISEGAAEHSSQAGVASRAIGILRIKAAIDRDALALPKDRLVFGLLVRDSPDADGTRHSASASVTVSVVDINDNAPSVTPHQVFRVRENSPAGTPVVGVVDGQRHIAWADPDSGVNARVEFRLLDVLVLRRDRAMSYEVHKLFEVSPSGEIQTTSRLDRETHAEYQLRVSATNAHANPRLSSTAEIRVRVEDENDSPPGWTPPMDELDRSVNISTEHRLNAEVTAVKAVDPDELSNVTYSLVGVDRDQPAVFFLAIDPATGVIRLVARPSPGQHEVMVRATDAAKPVFYAETRLLVNVMQRSAAGGRGGGLFGEANVSLSVIVGMVATTGLVSVALVSAIVCVRRRSVASAASSGSNGGGSVGACGAWEKEQPRELAFPESHRQQGDGDDDHDCCDGCPDPLLFSGGHVTASAGPQQRQSMSMSPLRHLQMSTFCQMQGGGYGEHAVQLPQMMLMQHHQQLHQLLSRNEEFVDGCDSADSGRGCSEDGAGGHQPHHQLHHQLHYQLHQQSPQHPQYYHHPNHQSLATAATSSGDFQLPATPSSSALASGRLHSHHHSLQLGVMGASNFASPRLAGAAGQSRASPCPQCLGIPEEDAGAGCSSNSGTQHHPLHQVDEGDGDAGPSESPGRQPFCNREQLC